MKLFGTDGIRGRANEPPLVPEELVRIGGAIAHFFGKKGTVLIGGDTRESTGMIASALTAGITSAGANVLNANVIPTPIVSFFTPRLRASCGVVVSASHNPWEDNGIKIFGANGLKLTDRQEEELEKIIQSGIKKSSATCGTIRTLLDWQGAYIAHLKRHFRLKLSGLKIVLDLANGAACSIAPLAFSSFGASPVILNSSPNGRNINLGCGATSLEGLRKAVINSKANVGLAFDGDADRLIAVDEQGKVFDGDSIMAIFAASMKAKRKLRNNTLVATHYSNLGLAEAMEKLGIRLEYTGPGDRQISELIESRGYSLGGEKSGHIIVREIESTGNGLVTALKLLEIMQDSGKPLSALNLVREYPQVLLSVKVRAKPPIESLKRVSEAVHNAEKLLGAQGRVLVRYSGTEPLARIMIEGKSEKVIKPLAETIADAFREEVG